MPVFATGVQQVNSSITTSVGTIWKPDNTSTTTYGALGSVTTGAVLRDLIIQNTGTATLWVGTGTALSTGTSLFINPGGELILYGYVGTGGQSGGTLLGISSGTTSSLVGLASIQNAVV